MNNSKGVIYILTNPSFPEYIKIGYASNMDNRLKQLNRSECIPFAFRVYATYEVDVELADKKIHSIIDTLRPELHAIESINGKNRVREFYAMSPEDAYGILEAIAEIHNRATDKYLKKHALTAQEKKDGDVAEDVRKSNFSFFACGFKKDDIIQFCNDKSITCKVASDRKVEYNGELYSLTALAQMLTGKSPLQGPAYFEYDGERLTDRRERLGV